MRVSNVKILGQNYGINVNSCICNNCMENVVHSISFLGKSKEIKDFFGSKVECTHEGFFIGSCKKHVQYLHVLRYMMILFSDITKQMFINTIKMTEEEIKVSVFDYTGLFYINCILYLMKQHDGVSKEDIYVIMDKIIKYYIKETGYSDIIEYAQKINDGFVFENYTLSIILFLQIKQEFSSIKFPLRNSCNNEKIREYVIKLLNIIQHSRLINKLEQC